MQKKVVYRSPTVIRLGTVTEHTGNGRGLILDMHLLRRTRV